MLPQTGIADVRKHGTGNDDPIAMPTQEPVDGGESMGSVALCRELKAGGDEVFSAERLEHVAAAKDVLHTQRMFGIAHPVKLDATQAFASDRTSAEISPIVLLRRARSCFLDQAI